MEKPNHENLVVEEENADLPQLLPRLFYLTVTHRVRIPEEFLRFLPLSGLFRTAHGGLYVPDVDLTNTLDLYRRGSEGGPGSAREARLIVAHLVREQISELPLENQLSLWERLSRFVNGSDGLIQDQIVDLSEVRDVEPIERWTLTPYLDVITGGMYQSLVVLMGRPGVGKTSMMCHLAEMASRAGYNITFIQNELSASILLGKMLPILKRHSFRKGDRLICVSGYPSDLIEEMIRNQNPNRIVFFDSPDSVGVGDQESRRFALEAIYRDLVRLKLASRAVFVSSQPRRRDASLSMSSVAESWAKAWYADLILTLTGPGIGPITPMTIRAVKNRFGPSQRELTIQFNLVSLSVDELGWEDPDESTW